MPLAERLQFPGPLLIRIRCSDTSWKAALSMKVQHEGALTHLCIIRKNGQVTHTARQVACHSLNNLRGKRSSIPPHKTRPDSPVPTLQGPCDLSPKWRGTLRFLTPLEMRPSSITPKTVEAREAPPKSTVSRLLRGTLRSSLRSLAQVEGTQGFLTQPEKDLENPPSTHLESRFPYHDSRAKTRSPSPCAWRTDFPDA